ncbi:MAG: HAD family hydrolase [Thiotrichales bacterium]|nr:MAG: HAD family hydrolase [Thiotrichales bacterium]
MLSRISFALKQAWKNRQLLWQNLDIPSMRVTNITKLNCETLKTTGIKAVILDFDGVLAAHGELKVSKKITLWLQDCVKIFGKDKVFLLSNKPTEARKQYFKKHFPTISFVVGKRKKPYPDGINTIQKTLKTLANDQIVIIDDRLFTGVLAGHLAGIKTIYVTKALKKLYKHPIRESFFVFLRIMENFIIEIFSLFK